VAIDLATERMVSVDLGKPFSIAKDTQGRLVTSQAVPGGGVVVVSVAAWEGTAAERLERSAVHTSIPWNGKWDLLTVGPGETVWGAVAGGDAVFREQSPGEAPERYSLPVYRVIPSLPQSDKPWDQEELARLSRVSGTVEHMVALADGTLVFTSSSSGGAIGAILPDR
jgi:hypothetical protein